MRKFVVTLLNDTSQYRIDADSYQEAAEIAVKSAWDNYWDKYSAVEESPNGSVRVDGIQKTKYFDCVNSMPTVLRVKNISWNIDIDMLASDIFDGMHDMPADEAAGYVGLDADTYESMSENEIYSMISDTYANMSLPNLYKELGLPLQVDAPVGSWYSDLAHTPTADVYTAITDWLQETYGYAVDSWDV